MGLPTAAVLEEEVVARDDSNSAVAFGGDSANLGEDPASTLEETARKALECPCLDALRHGPCGGEFSKAFLCFVKSQQPEKGSDCVEPFKKMQHCMTSNSKKFRSVPHSDVRVPMAGEGQKFPTEEEETEAEDMDMDMDMDEDDKDKEQAYSSHGLVPPPPEVPVSSIRLPPWYKMQDSDQGSR